MILSRKMLNTSHMVESIDFFPDTIDWIKVAESCKDVNTQNSFTPEELQAILEYNVLSELYKNEK